MAVTAEDDRAASGRQRRRVLAAGRTADADAPAPGLRFASVSHAYDGVPVLRDISIAVGAGEIVCLLGPSGCGKTTLLRLAAGLERLQTGRVEIGGRVVADARTGTVLPPERRRVGLMFQDYALFPHLTVGDNIAFGIAGTAGGEAWVQAALARMGLSDFSSAYPHTLSGGQQQRCALLRALAPHPDVLLLDEPFSGLDMALRAQVRDETAAFLHETGIATLIVTHDPEEAMSIADRLAVMAEGEVIQQGTPADVYLAPVNPFVAGLFGPLNALTGRVDSGRVDTPLGPFAAGEWPDGASVTVLIRPENIAIDPAGGGAKVMSSRLLGGLSAITVVHEGSGLTLRATVAGIMLPPAGSRVGVALDSARAFVFAAP